MAESERSKVSLRSSSEKRSRGSPTGCTPLQKGKRSTTELKEVGESQQTGSHHCQPRRRRLAFAKTDAWSDSEQIALVEFILLHKPGRRWPAEQDPRFWDSAAEYMYVAMRSKRLYNIYMYIYIRYNYAKNAILSRDFANASCLLCAHGLIAIQLVCETRQASDPWTVAVLSTLALISTRPV